MSRSNRPDDGGRPAAGAPRHWAEVLAQRHLEDSGWTIVEANYRVRGGEIDIVARDGDTLVFVEVRQRRSLRFGHPAETLDRRKLARVRATARRYLAERTGRHDDAVRFDVVLVVGDRDEPRLTHLRDVL